MLSINSATLIENTLIQNKCLSIAQCSDLLCPTNVCPVEVYYMPPKCDIRVPRNPIIHFDPSGGIQCLYCRRQFARDTSYMSKCILDQWDADSKPRPIAQSWGLDWENLIRPLLSSISVFNNQRMSEVEDLADIVMNILEAVPLIIQDFSSARSNSDIVCAIMRALKMVCRHSLTRTVVMGGDMIVAYLNHVTAEVTEDDDDATAQVGEFSPFEGLFNAEQAVKGSFEWIIKAARKLLDNAHQVVEGKAFQKLAAIFKYFLSFGVFQTLGLDFKKIGVSDWELRSMMRGHSSKFQFVVDIFDTIVWFCERAMQCAKGDLKWSSFFHSGKNYGKWVDDFNYIKTNQHRMVDPETFKADGFDYHEFVKKLEDTLENGKALEKYLDGKFEKTHVKSCMRELQFMKDSILSKRNCQKSRDAPFSILFFGPTSIAKTQITDISTQHFARVFGKDPSESGIYIRTPGDKFWSGYDASAWCVVIDDAAQLNPKLGIEDPTITESVRIKNNCRFTATSPNVEDKGKLAVRPDLFIVNTNVKDLNSRTYYSCPAALLRRFPFVVSLVVKPEFRKDENNETSQLDSNKIHSTPGQLMDIWEFSIEAVTSKKGNWLEVEYTQLHTFKGEGAIYQYLRWFTCAAKAHRENQDQARDARYTSQTIKLCENCCFPTDDERCQCAHAQVGTQAQQVIDESPLSDNLLAFQARLNQERDVPMEMYRDANGILQMRLVDAESSEDEAISESIIEDNRTLFTKALDASQDIWVIADCTARMLASYVKYSVSTVAQVVSLLGEKASMFTNSMLNRMVEIISFKQIMMAKEAIVAVGEKVYQKLMNWKVVGFCTLIATILAGAAGSRYLYLMFGECAGCKKLDTDLFESKGLVNDQIALEKENAALKVELTAIKGGEQKIVAEGMVETTWKKDNVWVTDRIEMSEFHVSQKTIGWKDMPFEEVCKRVSKNVLSLVHTQTPFVDWTVDMPLMKTTAIGLVGHLYVTNAHCFDFKKEAYARVSRHPDVEHASANIRLMLEREDMHFVGEDLVFFEILGLPPVMDIRNLFFENMCSSLVSNGAYIHCRYGMRPEASPVFRIHENTEKGVVTNLDKPVESGLWRCTPEKATVNGDCGSLLIAKSPLGPVLLGIHQLRFGNNDAAAIPITRKMLVKAGLNFAPQVEASAPDLGDVKLRELDRKSTAWQTRAEGKGEFFGSSEKGRFRTGGKSKVACTAIREYAVAEGFKDNFLPPVMVGPEVMGRNVTVNMQHPAPIRMRVIKRACSSYVKKIIKGLKKMPAARRRISTPLSFLEAVNGIPGCKFIDKMNRNTSMGFPRCKSKRNYIFPVEAEGYNDAVAFTPEVMAEVEKIEAMYREMIRTCPVFKMSLKDEPVTQAKVDAKKTRGFKGGPGAWQVIVRRVMLPFVKIFQENPFLFEGAPGMNCNSHSWKKLYEYGTKFGIDRCIAGDFGAFDAHMLANLILMIFRLILVPIFQFCECEPWMICCLYCIAEDVAFHICDVQGDIMMFFGGNPSGWALTVILNCLANSVYMRIVFVHVAPDGIHVDEFHIFIMLMTYGDDNMMNSSVDWFNHTVIVNTLAQYGIEYTMADKKSESRPFINISEITFLKRSFVPVDGGDRVACPLAWESIEKMLTKCVPSKTICPEEQAVQTIRSAIGEFFQYGPEMYKENCDKMHRIIKAAKLESWVSESTFPSYEDLLERHYAGCLDECSTCLSHIREESSLIETNVSC